MLSTGTICTVTVIVFGLQLYGVNMVRTTEGGTFNCFTCSFTESKPRDEIDCLNNTNYLKPIVGKYLKCGNYCVTSEVWDKSTKTIKSLFRSCSVWWGNKECNAIGSTITCKTSCKGEFCNNFTIEDNRIDTLCNKYSCDDPTLSASGSSLSVVVYIVCVFIVIMGYMS